MLRKAFVMAVVAASLMIPVTMRASTNTDTGVVTVTAPVDAYFAWTIPAGAGTPITVLNTGWNTVEGGVANGDKINAAVRTIYASIPLAAATNSMADLSLLDGGDGFKGVLTGAAATAGDVLDTSYTFKDTTVPGTIPAPGGAYTAGGAYVAAGGAPILAAKWKMVSNALADTPFQLIVKATPTGAKPNPKAGDYIATCIVRATW